MEETHRTHAFVQGRRHLKGQCDIKEMYLLSPRGPALPLDEQSLWF